MTKFSHILILLFFANLIYSQQMPDMEAESDWLLSTKLGFITIEVEGSHKSTLFATGGSLAKEFLLSDHFFLFTGLDHIRTSNDFQSTYQTHNFLQVPVGVSSFIGDKNKTSAYVGIGVYASYLLLQRSENIALNVTTSESGLGFNFGGITQLGISHVITNTLRARLGVGMQSDFAQAYKKDLPAVKLTDGMFFEFGFGIQL